MAIKSPFPYLGGKARIAPLVWERFGDVPNYVEAFFGSGAVLLNRPHEPRIETVNDADALLCNFWRAVQADPDAVAQWADGPVSEPDLHARHLWLVTEGRTRVERLTTDPHYYDAQAAGWWVWGISQWIGSGWCVARPATANVWPPELGTANLQEKLPHLGDAGRGVHRQLPHLGNAGRGVHRQDTREALVAYMRQLQDRLRRVRVCCGDWSRVLGPSPTTKLGMTAVFLDPPYSHEERDTGLYSTESATAAAAAREWAIAHGDDPQLRIAFCGYAGEHEFPATWEAVRWKAHGGYGSQGQGRGRENAERETVWFSPHCLTPDRPQQMAMAL